MYQEHSQPTGREVGGGQNKGIPLLINQLL